MLRRLFLVLALILGTASPSYSHSPIPGIEGFYVGLLDPFRALPQLLALGTVGLLVAGFESRHHPWFLGAFLLTSLAGIIFGVDLAQMQAVLLAAAVVAGLWAGLLPGRYAPVAFALVAIAGVYLGAISIPDPGPLRARIITVSGSFLGLNIGFLYFVGGLLMVKEKFTAPAVRISIRSAAIVLGCIAAFVLINSLDTPGFSPDR